MVNGMLLGVNCRSDPRFSVIGYDSAGPQATVLIYRFEYVERRYAKALPGDVLLTNLWQHSSMNRECSTVLLLISVIA